MERPFATEVTPDWAALRDCILRRGTPERVHHIELFLDLEVQQAIAGRYGLLEDIAADSPFALHELHLRVQRLMGYDYVRCGLDDVVMPLRGMNAADTAELQRAGGRHYVDEHRGPITSWEEFERYPWPDVDHAGTRSLEWFSEHLPEGMCIIVTGGFAHFAEYLNWLMGYETLCYALFDQRDLVRAISQKLMDIFRLALDRMLQFERVKFVWGSDDMGFRSATLISPADLREFVLPGHKMMAGMSHAAGRPYLLHACGNLREIMDDLIDDVQIDAKHSFEDTIESVIEDKALYGGRLALLGGIDVDFLCRADEAQIRRRVRETLEQCLPGGGYVLGSGNSVANYVPLDHYLAMMDEGRRFHL